MSWGQRLVCAVVWVLALQMLRCAHAPAPAALFEVPLAPTCREGRFFPEGALADDAERMEERRYTSLYRAMREPPIRDHVRGDAFRCLWAQAFAVRGHEVVRVSQEAAGPTIVYTRLRPKEGATSETDLEIAYHQERVLSGAEWTALRAQAMAAKSNECDPLMAEICHTALDGIVLRFERSMADGYVTDWQQANEKSSLATFCDGLRVVAATLPPQSGAGHRR